ncbi:non-ribosomal peptide synthetase [Trichormus variabilis]|uniref:Non-ribosomal peptide synthetase n=1 Tax=Trichormus variabilis SAG 1403-4b TaxID=447716 RepID=A0A3S1AE15_ANAVA|nr:non-ribosomal peptide synthetase [Trichormus variabilis]MBD2625726.1 amino acid adenylation domain-containing protein [Trichormus variabilis FACHB-164]RUS99009.1 non-ribosomal peptide synthetase [Trichormus variabilis SAG 1403-4b]
MTQSVNDFSTVVELLRYKCLEQLNTEAFTFLPDGEAQATSWTYGELERQSRAIACQLQALNLTGQRALLLYPPGLDYLAAFFGCLYAGVVAVPAYPPRNHRNTPRILAILKDAQAAVILTTSGIASQVQNLLKDEFDTDNIHWLTTDNLEPGIEADWQEPVINTDTLAFLQYTSGSTGTPKGVMLTHGNLLHNAEVTRQYMEHTPSSKFVTWLPAYHDMGLIGGILQPLYGGFACIMMPPASFLQRPYRWLKTISDYRGTTSGAPNFAYQLCIDKITPEQRQTLDLSSWDVVFNGAEPIRQETLERFAQTFAECGFRPEAFYPCYGMAEATLMVSGSVKSALVRNKSLQKTALECNHVIDYPANAENSIQIVSCGRVVPQQQIVIANPDTLTRCAADEVGEIWVSGPSIGHGYWNRPEETAQTFGAYLQDTGSGPFLRTGDLGFLHDGELFVTGRAKDLIIIRGRNLYPQDIELTAERSHKMLRAGSVAAFAVEVETEEQLVVVQELEFRAKPNIEEVTTAIRKAITEEHEVQVYAVVLIKAGTISKTSSGKIQRRATKARFLEGTLEVVGSSILEINQTTEPETVLTRSDLLKTAPEQRQLLLNSHLQKLVSRVLRVKPEQIDFQQPLSILGLDSLKVFELKNRIELDFEVAISVVKFFDGAGIAELTKQILDQVDSNRTHVYLPISKVEKNTHQHPLTFTQQQLWFINQLQPGTATYNIPIAVYIPGKLNFSALVNSLNAVIQRYEILRTSFELANGEPVQKVVDVVNFTLPEIDLQHLDQQQQETEIKRLSLEIAQTAFDLGTAPLLTAKLLKLHPEKSILLLTLHHLVGDGLSINILVKELSTIYHAFCAGEPSPLSELPLQYSDFVYWQRQYLQREVLEQHLAYWQHQLSGDLPVLQLPTDKPRPPIQTFKGAQQKFVLSKALTEEIKQFSKGEDATLFMTLLAAFQTLLYRYTGQEDILVGSPIANRNRAEIEQLIGCFVNTLVLRSNLAGNPSFKELLARVRKVAIEAYTHPDLPFEKLVEALQPNRDLSYNPLFQVMFVLQNQATDNIWKTEELETETAKFDVLLSMIESEAGLTGTLEYNTDLFNGDTITRMVGHFQTLLEGIVSNSHQHISELPILTPAERQTLLFEWNNTQIEYPQFACIHHLFEAHVDKTPDAIAVVFENQQLTYQELNKKSNQLAHYLQNLGVKPDTLVGICMERSLEMVIGILAIMKAGGAYLPIDPSYPQERLAFMLTDAQLSLLLVQPYLVEQLPPHQAKVINVGKNWGEFANYSQVNPESNIQLQNSAYVIYTSGSTGKPKGAINTHQGLCNRLLWMQDTYKLTSSDKVLQKTPFSFDVSVWEFFWPLFTGAALVVAKPGGHQDASYLVQLINQEQITTLHFVPSMLPVFLEAPGLENCQSLKRVICSGEALPVELQTRFFECLKFTGLNNVELHNLYGPTEAAIDVTSWKCQPDYKENIVPIGRPIANTQIYILDSQLQPVPIGIAGELYIGGVGLARGYWQRAELTNEKFITSPFDAEKRLYKTGDLARYRADGTIEFLGRIDYQVKLRGFRIELGEIEAVLGQYPKVRETVVIAREDIPNNHRLVAYVIPHADNKFSGHELRDYLKDKLPDYMIPSAFVELNTFPLTPNGKINRQALPVPDVKRPDLKESYEAPNSEVEKAIAKIWLEILQVAKVGVNDNFFDLGGNSLLMVQVNHKLRELLHCDISIVEMFQNPTIKSLAKYINLKSKEVSSFESLNNRIQKQRESVNRQKILMKRSRN